MNKKLMIIMAVAVSFAFGAATYAAYTHFTSDDKEETVSASTHSQVGGAITVSGTMGCLTLKNSSGPTDSSCAIGIKADDGKSYALNAQDPTISGSVPTGKRVKVSGTLTEQASKYDIAGVIQVTSLERE